MIDYIALFMLYFGLFFLAVGVGGIFKFHDLYLRLHSASKVMTFGFSFIIMGTGLLVGTPDAIAKSVIAITFQFATAPLAAQMIARAAILRGLKPRETNRDDKKAEFIDLVQNTSKLKNEKLD